MFFSYACALVQASIGNRILGVVPHRIARLATDFGEGSSLCLQNMLVPDIALPSGLKSTWPMAQKNMRGASSEFIKSIAQ
jgi:hypothetical protein